MKKKFDDTLYLTKDLKRRGENGYLLNILLLLSILLLCTALLLWFFSIDTVCFTEETAEDKLLTRSPVCTEIPNDKKFDCYPDAPVTEKECISRGCCYSVPKNTSPGLTFPPLNVPYCYYPSNYVGYVVKDIVNSSLRFEANLQRVQPSGFPNDISNLNLLVTFIDNCMLRIKVSTFVFCTFLVSLNTYLKILIVCKCAFTDYR